MPPSHFTTLHWESTRDRWWYASPIDYAAANGFYDLVIELLHTDTNLLIKLTSLRRIQRFETVWDDNNQFEDVAKCRAKVARNLVRECDKTGRGNDKYNSLIHAGYGGWLLYTAASAGNVEFVLDLLGRDPLLVFGEGEYGVTDILYAAARSKNCEVFKLLLDSALSRKGCLIGSTAGGAELEDESGRIFKREMVNRAMHAAARGGNWEIVKELLLLLGSGSEILSYRDALGCTVLHAAAGRGQVEVVRNLIESSSEIINSTDAQGNTALHVASYKGYLPVVEVLIRASPSLELLTNHHGDTFLHMAVSGFRSPSFQRLDKHTELMKKLVSEEMVNMKHIINVRNNAGRTALHVAVIDNIQCDIVELLMSVSSIDLNIRDADGMTPLDYLKQRPKSASCDILIRQLISAGGISNCKDFIARNVLVSHLKSHGIISASPGTLFSIPDAKILLYTGIENSFDDGNSDQASEFNDSEAANSPCNTRFSLKNLLQLPKRRETKEDTSDLEDNYDSVGRYPMSLRQRYSKPCTLPNNKRTFCVRTSFPSPSSSKKYFAAGLMQGIIKVKPHVPLSTTHSSNNKQKHVDMMGPSCSN